MGNVYTGRSEFSNGLTGEHVNEKLSIASRSTRWQCQIQVDEIFAAPSSLWDRLREPIGLTGPTRLVIHPPLSNFREGPIS